MITGLLALWVAAESWSFTTEKTMEPIPVEVDAFMRLPMDLAVDGKGRVFVADAIAKCVFVWDADGSFVGTFGEEGGGPGEFTFMGRGGPQAYLSVVGDKVHVFDGGRQTISVFDQGLVYQSSTTYQSKGRVEYFQVTPKGHYFVHHMVFQANPPVQRVEVFDEENASIALIKEIEDKTWKPGGSRGGFSIIGYAPATVVHYAPERGRVIVGDSNKPSFEVFDIEGALEKRVIFAMSRPEISDEDKAEFREVRWIKNNPNIHLDFPEEKAFYTHILPHGDRFLVFSVSPFYCNIEGFIIDEEGNREGVLRDSLGENGFMRAIGGNYYAVRTDDYGDFVVEKVALPES